MIRLLTADDCRQAGLLPYHFQFIERYTEPKSSRYWLLMAPPGTAKTKLAARLASWELSTHQTARVLVLAPAALLFMWRVEIAELDTSVEPLIIDRKKYLELKAETAKGDQVWPCRSVVVMSIDLAKRQDIRASIVSTAWDFVIIDESHLLTGQRFELFRAMINAGCMNRALLLANTPGTIFDGVATFEVEVDKLTDWSGNYIFASFQRNVCSVQYTRSEEEADFLRRLIEVANELVNAFVSGHLQREILLRSASSATYTVETVLRRLIEGWRPVRNKLAHGMRPSTADLDTIQARLDTVVDEVIVESDSQDAPLKDTDSFLAAFHAVEDLLDSIDDITVDSKIEALIRHLGEVPDIGDRHLCIWTSFHATANYLNASLSTFGLPVFCITGAIDTFARSEILNDFQRSKGLLIVTDVGLEGEDLHFVAECINYDLPMSHLQSEQRWGRFLRYGRQTPFRMTVLKDDGDGFDWEHRLLAQFLTGVRIESKSKTNVPDDSSTKGL